jgi:hypothetical protein
VLRGEEGGDVQAYSVQEAHDNGLLAGLQRSVSMQVTEKTRTQLLQKYEGRLADPAMKVNVQENLARLHSLQGGVGTAWMGLLPTKTQWELDDATVTSALRFQLGVSPGPPAQLFYRCSCSYQGRGVEHSAPFACTVLTRDFEDAFGSSATTGRLPLKRRYVLPLQNFRFSG